MNNTSKNLTEEEINGRRQLVFDLVHLPTQELFDRSISHLQLFVCLPDELVAEVTKAFETKQANRESNTAIDAGELPSKAERCNGTIWYWN